MPKVAFTTVGCRLNQAESDSMSEQLSAGGLVPASDAEPPDVVVINTCTVTREATKASRSAIRRAVKSHPGARVVVTGCYAVSDRAEVEAIDGVDLVIGNDDKERFAEALGAAAPTAPLLQVSPGAAGSRGAGKPGGSREAGAVLPGPRVRANLKVQTGCDEWCSFCIIPTTRGPLRSLDEDELVAQARARVAAGAREIVLTGVHLGKYSYDHGGDEGHLIRLLERLLAIRGLWRVRLSSILSRHLTEELLAFMAAEPRVCRHLHVPLQAGSDRVLEAMHRPYRIDDYIASCERAMATLPGLALATDVIVGFPGESDADFAATMDVVRRLRFAKLHVFRFSARPGTPAATMEDQVTPEIRKQRSKALIELGNEIRRDFLAAHLGRPLEVLVEDERVVDGSTVCSGQTDDHTRVWLEAGGLLGALVLVRGTQTRADGIRGATLLEVLRR